jgi:hypothetical protein
LHVFMCKILANMTQVSDVTPGPLVSIPECFCFILKISAIVHLYLTNLQHRMALYISSRLSELLFFFSVKLESLHVVFRVASFISSSQYQGCDSSSFQRNSSNSARVRYFPPFLTSFPLISEKFSHIPAICLLFRGLYF